MSLPSHVGPYRIERLLGTGSFATVWLGHDPVLGARVAIKVLAENWSHDLRVRERFLDEARLLWHLDHDRIIRVHALDELPDGRPYLVMAWADGGSLRDRLGTGPMRAGPGLRLLREIAAGVAVLHEHGIVHRDLTPGNVLFRSGPGGAEQVVIADLGLAKALAAASGLTARAGTPGYMAPEQDDPLSIVDTRTDVYGLGRLGLRLLSAGARSGVPATVFDVLRTATSRRPADRHPDAAAFAAALDRATAVPSAARRRWTRAGGAALAAAAIWACAADGTDRGYAADPSGRITVLLPDGWRGTGARWADPDGALAPALVVSPAAGRWRSPEGGPGAFVGVVLGRHLDPAGFVARRQHPGCVADPVWTSRLAEIEWTVARYTSCPTGHPVIVEAAGEAPDGSGLVYVQVTPPTDAGPGFVEALLTGVRITGPPP
ncbi:tRNA A-37 threonylcarbamoyl transferase component Bud32 [Allocatelliglobosispora scoriae]|uniref:non-specific serine/threonine protein kinase n=1 Tax=Allocatelliglobosispora scoriae TaxID=643052 RepID=A0A841C244_9ACTN|nr:serine/threonine-protein kinase [Allocatelliglobosispora scoriae]MBB5873995.1 tRNA A-37 threonylcarbamoyl transferase component Bud32 [Allocatelliglobosispora scoriae]